jgi:D-alanine-D-alanine ligase
MTESIAVIFGGPSDEHDISILTGLQSSRILSNKYDVKNIYWSKDNKWYLVNNALESIDFVDNDDIFKKELTIKYDSEPGFYLKKKKISFEVAVNACHGGPGEDGTLQSLLSLLNINYTGPSLTTSQIGMDKYVFFTLMKEIGIPVLDKHLVSKNTKPNFSGPYILKPRFGGSSIGVEVVEDYETALKLSRNSKIYSQGATIEKFLENSNDLLIGIRTYPNLDFSEIEKPIRTSSFELFSYNDKYLDNGGLEGSKRELPATISTEIESQIKKILTLFVEQIEIRGISRVDFLLHNENLYLNEVNTIPGSHALYLWQNIGKSKFELLNDMIEEAKNSVTHWSTEGSDGVALKSAKDIQSKLG